MTAPEPKPSEAWGLINGWGHAVVGSIRRTRRECIKYAETDLWDLPWPQVRRKYGWTIRRVRIEPMSDNKGEGE